MQCTTCGIRACELHHLTRFGLARPWAVELAARLGDGREGDAEMGDDAYGTRARGRGENQYRPRWGFL